METPHELFRRGYRLLPAWNDQGPDKEARFAEALAVITRAAEAGSVDAMDYLGTGGEDREVAFGWAVAAARAGDLRSIGSRLTDGDEAGPEGQRVLAAARAGEAWAALAVGQVYGLGMQNGDGVYVATLGDAWGWLPAAADPDAEGRRWVEQAAAAGFAPALLSLAHDDKLDDPARALERVEAALGAEPLTAALRRQAEGLLVRLLDDVDAPTERRFAVRERLAAGGDAASICWLADAWRRGEGVPKDLARARALYEQAAAQGEVDALRELGKLCEQGKGGPKDLDRARALYEEAAELGADPYARDRLAKKFGLTWYARGRSERGRSG